MAVTTDSNDKVTIFRKIQEYLLHKAVDLLPEFLQNILDLATNKCVEIKRGLASFLEKIW